MASPTEPPVASGAHAFGASGADVRRVDGAVAGVVAAGVALGAGELVCGIAGSGPTLVTAVGTQFIDRFAASLKDVAIALFGTNDKVALIVGIVVVSLGLGGLLGRASIRRPLIGVLGFAAFGALGLFSFLADPLGSTGTGLIAAFAAAVAGIATLFGLLHLLRLGRPSSGDPAPASALGAVRSRRLFLVSAGSLAAFAAGAAVLGRRFGRSDVVEAARESTILPEVETSTGSIPTGSTPAGLPPAAGPAADVVPTVPASGPSLDGLTPYIVPNSSFYRIDTALQVPQVDVTDWRLEIVGMVDEPFTLSYDELVGMSTTQDTVTLSCVSNEVGGSLIGNAVWQGVPLADVLERAGVQDGATQIVGRSVDNFTAGFPTGVALDGRTAMIAVGMNGEPLPAEHGFPARLVIAGLYGYVSATKWLREIELTTWEAFDGYWVPRGWSKEGPIKTESRIDVPRSGQGLDAGPQMIAGVAWSPPIGIGRVEVQVDDGEWMEARLGEVVSGNTWVQWFLEWEATSGDHTIQVRATDAYGFTQTEDRAAPAPDGATGWHRRSIGVR